MNEKEFIAALHAHQSTMVTQLYNLCAINSGSENLAGLEKMADALSELYTPLADEIHRLAGGSAQEVNLQGNPHPLVCGHHLYIRKRPHLKRRILLSGHMDTVYGIAHPFQTLYAIDENTVNGPGVADMKGGLLVMLHALQAFETLPLAQSIGWDVLINADEEIGSPSSLAIMDGIAQHYLAALIFEPATTPKGDLTRNRKGSGKLTLVVTGRAAHAGRSFYEGRNAICYMATVIKAIHALNGKRDGVTINVGKIAGGEALNIVAEKCVIKLDVRISDPSDEQWVRSQLDAITGQFHDPDYTVNIYGNFARPVKKVEIKTKRLFLRIQAIAQRMGLDINWQDSGGCCDGNNFAAHGVPVIDTLGVRGGHIHSSKEYILLDSLSERAILSGLLMQALAAGGLEELHS